MQPIKDYFLIGDLHTAALVSSRGSIDWMCLAHFDSPSVFTRLLDDRIGGSFSVDDAGYGAFSSYVRHTAVVETRFEKKDHAFTLRDFMLPRPTEEVVPHLLVRKITGVRGKATVRFLYDPRPNYAQQGVLPRKEKNMLIVRLEERSMWLHLPKNAKVRKRPKGSGFLISVEVEEGQTTALIMEYSHESRLRRQVRDLETETVRFWESWVAQGRFFEYCREDLIRSAITLKLMQFYPTGGLIAAPTTSLPEEIGGERNWDYRFVWIRDATFTLYAFSILGYWEESEKFFRFIEHIVEEAQEIGEKEIDLALMYTIWGQPVQREHTLHHLKGYGDSRPVRIGNGAAHQFQLDLYGSLIDAYYFAWKGGIPLTAKGREVIIALVEKISRRWEERDSGIWEVRSGIQHFTYSKVMAWVGVERAVRMAEELGIGEETVAAWRAVMHDIEKWIWTHCFDEARGTFIQHPGTAAQDATNFLFILLHFLNRHDPNAKNMTERTAEELGNKELFMYRYHAEDGLSGSEGAFILCSFWYIAALAAVGEIDKADELLESFRSWFPDSGLIAEEVDPATGAFLGNFPQAFSHIGFIIAAYYIDRYRRKREKEEEEKKETEKATAQENS